MRVQSSINTHLNSRSSARIVTHRTAPLSSGLMVWLACAVVVAVEILLAKRFGGAIGHLALEARSRWGPTRAIRIFTEVGLFELLTLDGALTFRREDLYHYRAEIQRIFCLIPKV